MKRKILIMLILLSTLLISCIESEQIEKIGIIDARGLDSLESDLIEATLIVYQFSPESESITKTRSGKGYTVKGAVEDTENTSSYRLSPGKIKLEMYGKELAKKGILPYLDTLAREAQMADMMYLALSDTTAKEILSVDESVISKNPGEFLYELIENETTDHNIPRKTVQDFLRNYYDIGHDNVLPIFEIHEGIPRQKAIAVLRGDKYVGEIKNEQSILISLMNSTVKRQIIEMNLPLEPFKNHLEKRENPSQEMLHTAYRIEKGNSNTKVKDEEKLLFQTDTKIEMRLLEQSAGLVIRDEQVIKLLEKELEKNLTAQFQKLLATLQELNADSFGYGRHYRILQKDGKLTKEQWRKLFPEIKVDFNVNVEIIRHGITE